MEQASLQIEPAECCSCNFGSTPQLRNQQRTVACVTEKGPLFLSPKKGRLNGEMSKIANKEMRFLLFRWLFASWRNFELAPHLSVFAQWRRQLADFGARGGPKPQPESRRNKEASMFASQPSGSPADWRANKLPKSRATRRTTRELSRLDIINKIDNYINIDTQHTLTWPVCRQRRGGYTCM